MSHQTTEKIRLATVWLSGCSGCHMSLLDLDEQLLELGKRFHLVYSPLVDCKTFPDGVDVVLVEGAVNNGEQMHMAQILRERSRIVVALGDCAVMGNVPAMRNGLNVEHLLRSVYASDSGKEPPGLDPEDGVPLLLPRVSPLHGVIPVDLFLPGCPPGAQTIGSALTALLNGEQVHLSENMLRFG